MKLLQHILLATVFIFSSAAHANDFAAILGMRTNSWDISPSTGITASGDNSFQGGVLGFIDLSSSLLFRTGFIYTQRAFTAKTATASYKYEHNYFDIPAGLMYKFSDFGGVFAGGVLALNTGKNCTGNACSTDGVKSSLMGLQFGASFKFAPQLGGEIYYEMISGPIQTFAGPPATEGKDAKSVVVNFMFTFE